MQVGITILVIKLYKSILKFIKKTETLPNQFELNSFCPLYITFRKETLTFQHISTTMSDNDIHPKQWGRQIL